MRTRTFWRRHPYLLYCVRTSHSRSLLAIKPTAKYLTIAWAALQIHDRSPKSRPVASLNQSQTQLTRPVPTGLGMQRAPGWRMTNSVVTLLLTSEILKSQLMPSRFPWCLLGVRQSKSTAAADRQTTVFHGSEERSPT